MSRYWKHKMYAVAMVLLVIGGINWGIKSFLGKDAVTYFTGKNVVVANLIFAAVGVAALVIGLHRDSYLPFLGQTVIPCSVLTPQTPENADIEVEVLASPGTKILYWAAEPSNKDLKDLNDWKHAYLAYRNAGVAVSDKTGVAKLKVRKPQPYSVPHIGKLSPHVHYRKCDEENLLSRIYTVDLNSKEFFENYVGMQESLEPVIEKSEFNYVKPAQALEEANTVTLKTLSRSLMPQGGAPDEGRLTTGTPIDNAFTAVNSPLVGAMLDVAFSGKGI